MNELHFSNTMEMISQKFSIGKPVFCLNDNFQIAVGVVKNYYRNGMYAVSCGMDVYFNENDMKPFDVNSIGKVWEEII